jgi:segregation and condensation protein B
VSVPENLKNIVEAALLAAGRPLSLDALQGLFDEIESPTKKELRVALEVLVEDYAGRGIEIVEVSTGWRIQVGKACSPWVSRLWDEKPARYSRALMETLALIAYRQPITRGEIEDVRGVSVSTNIVKTLIEREWVRVVGQRDVPGKPSLYGTTREFLDYFGLKSLDELPTLAELRDLDEINRELDLEDPETAGNDMPPSTTPAQAGIAPQGPPDDRGPDAPTESSSSDNGPPQAAVAPLDEEPGAAANAVATDGADGPTVAGVSHEGPAERDRAGTEETAADQRERS